MKEDMMSTKKTTLLILIVLFVLSAVLTMAVIPPDPTPATCSPGFWKQPHHFQYWVGYQPADPYPGTEMTLLDALQGGKATRESRFIVAGWLNAANPDAPCVED